MKRILPTSLLIAADPRHAGARRRQRRPHARRSVPRAPTSRHTPEPDRDRHALRGPEDQGHPLRHVRTSTPTGSPTAMCRSAAGSRPPTSATRLEGMPPAHLRLRSDEHLVSLFRAGREEAFDVLHERHRRRLQRDRRPGAAQLRRRRGGRRPGGVPARAPGSCATTAARSRSSRGCTASCATCASTSCGATGYRPPRSRTATGPGRARTSTARSAAGTSCGG